MALYFFDVTDGQGFHPDEFGDNFENNQDARRQAIRLLPDLARDHLIFAEWEEVCVEVKDEAGGVIYRARLTLHEDKKISAD